MANSELRIGEVAARAGVSVDTLRYYERRRLLSRAPRTPGGYRVFSGETIDRVRFIKQAQELGFSLEEIGQLLTGGGGEAECLRVSDLLRAKLAELDEKIKTMQLFSVILADHLAACEREMRLRGRSAQCPVIDEIAHHNDSSQGKGGEEQ
jgi:DNA-binding transcriptional MerR regulator